MIQKELADRTAIRQGDISKLDFNAREDPGHYLFLKTIRVIADTGYEECFRKQRYL